MDIRLQKPRGLAALDLLWQSRQQAGRQEQRQPGKLAPRTPQDDHGQSHVHHRQGEGEAVDARDGRDTREQRYAGAGVAELQPGKGQVLMASFDRHPEGGNGGDRPGGQQ